MKKQKVGLALGSGGARGLAHIGVIKVLQENGIKIDYIAGSSFGAWVGAWYAKYGRIKELEEFSLGVNWKLMVDLLWDFSIGGGLMSGEKAEKFIRKNLGNIKFEDLVTPFTAVATDLKTGETVEIKKGDLTSAIRASMSVPIYFKPTMIDGRLLCDGGLSAPVPVLAVKKMGADIVVAVNLDGHHLLLPKEEKLESLFAVSQQTFNIARYNLAQGEVKWADIEIDPMTNVYGVVGWKEFLDAGKIIASGEAAMKEKMKELKKIL
ncbi:MAG: patatin-like phospholipase family protein [Candidatus Magasanikbacteria bacterium]